MNFEEYVVAGQGQEFKGDDLRSLLAPGVYVLIKNERPLYIGMGSRLLSSLSRKNSHTKRRWAVEQADRVLLFPCKSVKSAKELESVLIGRIRPKYNIQYSQNANHKVTRIGNVRVFNELRDCSASENGDYVNQAEV